MGGISTIRVMGCCGCEIHMRRLYSNTVDKERFGNIYVVSTVSMQDDSKCDGQIYYFSVNILLKM